MLAYLENRYIESQILLQKELLNSLLINERFSKTSGSYAGARYTSKLFSIIQTVRANNLDTYQYLNYLLENINNPNVNIESLLPYSNEMSKKFSNKL